MQRSGAALVPGVWWQLPEGRSVNQEHHRLERLSEAIASVKVCDKRFPFAPDCLKVMEAIVLLPFQALSRQRCLGSSPKLYRQECFPGY